MRYDYIPDLTERFPEGFDGVDMTPSFYGEPVDWSRALGYEPTYDELVESGEIEEPRKFEIGNTYRQVGIFGGVTYYTVEEISREEKKILLSEVWEDLDGNGTRPAKWHDLDVDENGNEKALDWKSKTYGEIWIFA
jgi:hypothetical protein